MHPHARCGTIFTTLSDLCQSPQYIAITDTPQISCIAINYHHIKVIHNIHQSVRTYMSSRRMLALSMEHTSVLKNYKNFVRVWYANIHRRRFSPLPPPKYKANPPHGCYIHHSYMRQVRCLAFGFLFFLWLDPRIAVGNTIPPSIQSRETSLLSWGT